MVKNCQGYHIEVFPIRWVWQFMVKKRGGGRGFLPPP